ncbi:MAG: hypothetical protein WD359_02535, partial [Dehalococcoidia bacterium]
LEHLLEPSNDGAAWYHTHSSDGTPRARAEALRMVRGDIRRARRFQAANPSARDRGEVAERVDEIRSAIDANPDRWSGRAGATDRKVLLGACAISDRVGKIEFYAGVRMLSDEAGVGVKGTHAALPRLCEDGWIREVTKGGGSASSVWRLERPGTSGNAARNHQQPTLSVVRDPEGCLRYLPHDVWRWEALGPRKEQVYALLGAEPIASHDVALILGIDPRTARKHLRQLALRSLAERAPDGWVRGDRDLDDLARELKVANKGERQRREHGERTAQRIAAFGPPGKRYPQQRQEVPPATPRGTSGNARRP